MVKKIKKVAKALKKASALHKKQSKVIEKHIKPFARKIQILTVGEQRAKVMGKSKVASIFKKGKEAIRKGRKK
jgi:hypothetical protein